MAFTKITNVDTANKGVVGLPDTPGLSTHDMQAKFDELATDVIIPKHNNLIDELEATTAAASVGSVNTTHASGANVQTLIGALDTYLYNYVNTKDTAMKSYVDGQVTSINGQISTLNNRVNAQDSQISNAVNTANSAKNTAQSAQQTALQAYNKAGDAENTAQDAKNIAQGAVSEVTLAVQNLTEYIDQMTHTIDPTTGQYEDIATIIVNLYNYMRPAPLTAQQYDDLGLTAEDYDSYGLTAYQYDMLGAQLLV